LWTVRLESQIPDGIKTNFLMTGTEKFDKLAPDIIASSENVEKKEAKAKQTSDGFSGLWKPQSQPNPILFCDFVLTRWRYLGFRYEGSDDQGFGQWTWPSGVDRMSIQAQRRNRRWDDHHWIQARQVWWWTQLLFGLVWFGHSNDQHLLKYGKSGTG